MALSAHSSHAASGESPRWNIFARTLEDLLHAAAATPLTKLDNLRERPGEELDPSDPESPRELVHREKVRRLILSLREPGTLPILNREDLERIRRYFRLSAEAQAQVRAAILATHIQRMVYERFSGKEDSETKRRAATLALRAAELLLPILGEALRDVGADAADVFRSGSGLGGDMGVNPHEDTSQQSEERLYAALESASDAHDRGTLALSLSYSAPTTAERLERARAARDAFSDALEHLDEQEPIVRASEPWRVWHAEARHGYDEADERVIDLGG